MMDKISGGALTVGQLRKALEGIPDNWEVGTANFGFSCFVEKAVRLSLVKKAELFVVSTDKHAGCFTEEELGHEDIKDIVNL